MAADKGLYATLLDEEQRSGVLSARKYASLCAFLAGTIGDQVSLKQTTYFANFPSALTQLAALSGAIVYPAIVGLAVFFGLAKCSQIRLPIWKPAVVAVLFVLHHILLNAGAGGATIPGTIVGVLVKAVIPVSMLINTFKVTMGLRYKPLHCLGAVFVLLGILITAEMGSFPLGADAGVKMFLVVASVIPLAGAFTFIEVSLTRHHPELFAVALWMWVCLFMSAISIASLPLSAWLNHVQIKDAIPDLLEGVECYVKGIAPAGKETRFDCRGAARCWRMNLVFGFLLNIAMPLSTRYGGSTLMWIVRALSVPLAAVCFAQPAVMGDHAVPVTRWQMIGLCVVALGVLMFNASQPTQRE